MSELRYPNESREYRDARKSLLKDEQELVDKVKSVAERRRNLPPGGQLKGRTGGSSLSLGFKKKNQDLLAAHESRSVTARLKTGPASRRSATK
jgi:predicted dithiol-disulfide oxidoreductase (DUF899 family)